MKAIIFRAFSVFLLFLLFPDLSGQVSHRPLAASYLGFGAYTLKHTDVFSFSSNPASLAQIKNASVGVYGERRFLLNELNNYTAAIGLPTRSGNFGVKINYSGFRDFNETQLGLAYGRSLGKKVDIGAQFNYNGIRITEYGSASAISFDAGTVLHLTENLHAGIRVSNPTGGKFGKDQKLSSVYSVGLGYEASEKFFISVEIEKEEDQPVNVTAGLQYQFITQLLVRAGISSATSLVWAGAGLIIKSFRVDVTSSYHPQLGLTPGLLFLFNFNKKEN